MIRMVDKGKGRMMDDFYVWGLSNYVEADDTFFTGGRWGSNNNSPSPPVSLTLILKLLGFRKLPNS